MARKLISRPLKPTGGGFVSETSGIEPPVPRAFLWERRLNREAHRGTARWWLYTIEDAASTERVQRDD